MRMERFVVGDDKSTPRTCYRVVARVVSRVNQLVKLGYCSIAVTDNDTGRSCICNGPVTINQLKGALGTVELADLQRLMETADDAQ